MTDDDARTWRDLANQLTPEQIAFYENAEREVRAKTGEVDDAFWLNIARHEAQSNMIKDVMGVTPPPDTKLPTFGHTEGDQLVTSFEGTTREVPDIGVGAAEVPQLPDYPVTTASIDVNVMIEGQQYTDGTTERTVRLIPITTDDPPDPIDDDCEYLVTLDDAVLDADGARRLGRALIDAADEIERLS